jgi:drug/metabolite transporter (DMT)-like permease
MQWKPDTRRTLPLDPAVAGPLYMLLAALLFTALNILVKKMGPGFRVWDIGFYRFSGSTLVLFLVFGRHKNLFKGHNTRLLIIRGCVGSIAFLSVVSAIRLLPVSTAVVIFFSFPAFSALFAFLIYKETVNRGEIVSILGVFVGVAILFDFRLTGGLYGQLFALAGGAFAGLTVTLIRALREKNGPAIIYLYFCTMGMLVTLPGYLQRPAVPATAEQWAMLAGLILCSVTGQLLMNQGFFYCRGWEGGLFMSTEVIFTAAVGILFLHDPVTWRFWSGGSMILICIAVMSWFRQRRQVPGGASRA